MRKIEQQAEAEMSAMVNYKKQLRCHHELLEAYT
jgi:hypothetical protein